MKKSIIAIASVLVMLSSCQEEKIIPLPNKKPIDEKRLDNQKISEIVVKKKKETATSKKKPYGGITFGYDVTQEYANENLVKAQVIDFEKFEKENPNRFVERKPFQSGMHSIRGKNAVAFSKYISNSTDATSGDPLFGGTLQAVFGEPNSKVYEFDAKYFYGGICIRVRSDRYQLNMSERLAKQYLKNTFLEDIKTKTPKEIVAIYGTHILKDVSTGGKFQIIFQAETTNSDIDSAVFTELSELQKNMIASSSETERSEKSYKNFNRSVAYFAQGGNVTNLPDSLKVKELGTVMSNWQSSLKNGNGALVEISKHGLFNIYDVVDDVSKKEALKKYVENYITERSVRLKK